MPIETQKKIKVTAMSKKETIEKALRDLKALTELRDNYHKIEHLDFNQVREYILSKNI